MTSFVQTRTISILYLFNPPPVDKVKRIWKELEKAIHVIIQKNNWFVWNWFFFISEVINIDESAFLKVNWPKNGVGKSGIDNVLNPCISKVKKNQQIYM